MSHEVKGMIYDIQGFSVQDGPGIRTTVFLKGCPLHCPWCHSPESQAFHPQLSWIAMRCAGTARCEERCIKACTKQAVTRSGTRVDSATGETLNTIHVDRTLCDNCGDCVTVCHPHALYLCGREYSVDDIIKKVSADISFFQHSGGGVTVSGGEALCQPEFTLELLKALKKHNIHTALDTTGYAPWETVEAVLPYTDLFLYDLKHMDSNVHKRVIGVPNERILENAQRIARAGGKLQIRVPVIPRFNDSEEHVGQVAQFCRSLDDAVTVVQLLPYHSMGVSKHLRISDEAVSEAVPPSEEKVNRLKEILEEAGLHVVIH